MSDFATKPALLTYTLPPIIPACWHLQHTLWYTFKDMREETQETRQTSAKPKAKRRTPIKPVELVISAVFIAVVAVLTITLVGKLALKRDTTNARAVSDKVIADIGRRDGAAIRSQGSPKFQSSYSAAELTQDFKNVEIATLKKPQLDRQIVVDTPSGRIVYFVYKYTALKVPFYVRTAIQHQSGHWYLTAITGNVNETALTGN